MRIEAFFNNNYDRGPLFRNKIDASWWQRKELEKGCSRVRVIADLLIENGKEGLNEVTQYPLFREEEVIRWNYAAVCVGSALIWQEKAIVDGFFDTFGFLDTIQFKTADFKSKMDLGNLEIERYGDGITSEPIPSNKNILMIKAAETDKTLASLFLENDGDLLPYALRDLLFVKNPNRAFVIEVLKHYQRLAQNCVDSPRVKVTA